MPTVQDLTRHLRKLYPLELASDWDNVGLLLGAGPWEVRRLMTCLTVSDAVVAEAVERDVDLIVSHHPILFRGAKKLSTESSEGRLLLPLMENRVAVYSPHTAFDNAEGGINDMVAGKLGLRDLAPLRKRDVTSMFKIVVFAPEDDLERVAAAMFEAGAGHIGEYSECGYRSLGTGTFLPGERANPTIGERGRREQVAEWRFEVICPKQLLDRVLHAMRQAHSYEEPAYDVYSLMAPPAGGEGRVGRLPQPMPLEKFAKKVKTVLRAGRVKLVGLPDGEISKVAIACGAAGEFLPDAARAKADVFVTGEMRFHDFYDARTRGVALVVAGHYPTERFALEELAKTLGERFGDVEVWASELETDPVGWV